MRNKSFMSLLIYSLAIVAVGLIVFPIAWLVLASFKTMHQVFQLPPQIIFEPTFDNYRRLFFGGQLLNAFFNSLAVSIAIVVLSLILGVPAAYSLSTLKNRVGNNISFWILSIRMAPAFAVIIPYFIIMYYARLIDTIWAVIITYLTFAVPFQTWLLKVTFEELPRELEEAALIDGANKTAALFRVVLPNAAPMIASASILTFVLAWNEFLMAFILTSRDARTVPVLITALSGTHRLDWPIMAAISTVSMLPAFAFITFVQRYLIKGLTMGAVK
ncbi:MAG: carbohydrate ABC transporter permease [Aigarchaeota archaeon]|nr:carbohydrate ABC transporter permease [Candidatus Calditenuaceae archaeon]MDW8022068.1 carbohydrate ABC transporter permease [Nitrososphaerota archaeon]